MSDVWVAGLRGGGLYGELQGIMNEFIHEDYNREHTVQWCVTS